MKGIKTIRELALEPKSKTTRWSFIKKGKNKYQIAVVQPGTGYQPVITLELPPSEAYRFYFDLYQQLKGIFEEISEHH